MTDLLGPASAPNAVNVRPSDARVFPSADSWFKGCSADNVDDGTEIEADWLNGMLAQLRNAIRGMGVTVDNADDDMLLKAIQAQGLRYVVDTGAANALVVTNARPVTSYGSGGFAMLVKVANDVTGAATINVDGLGAKSIVRADGGSLARGDWPGAAVGFVVYDGAKFQLLAVLGGSFAQGQCQLVYSGGNLVLLPCRGNTVRVSGMRYSVPNGGVVLSPAGLSANTLYYIYLKQVAGALTLEASTTGHATSTLTGDEIKTADETRLLVGMAFTTSAGLFVDGAAQRLVLSWFNRRSKTGQNNFASSSAGTTSSTLIELDGTIRVQFLAWADDDVQFNCNGEAYNLSNANCGVVTAIGYDGAIDATLTAFCFSPTAGSGQPLCIAGRRRLSEGFHFATIYGAAQLQSGATQGAWYGGTGPANDHAATYLLVSVNG